MNLVIKKEDFHKIIEDLVWELDVSFFEATIIWCERNGFEVEYAAELIKKNQFLFSKIQIDAEDMHYMKKTARLPIGPR